MSELLKIYQTCIENGFGRVRSYIHKELGFLETRDQQLRLQMALDDLLMGITRKIKEKAYEVSERILDLHVEGGEELEFARGELYRTIKKSYLEKTSDELKRLSTTYLWSEDKLGELVSEKLLSFRSEPITKT